MVSVKVYFSSISFKIKLLSSRFRLESDKTISKEKNYFDMIGNSTATSICVGCAIAICV